MASSPSRTLYSSPTLYSSEELRRLYPSNLKLQQVQIFMRHGERTPTSARFENAGLAAFWPCCSAVKQLVSTTMTPNASTWSPSPWRQYLETFGSDDNSVLVSDTRGEIEGMCNHGDLTDQGRRSSRALGHHLRGLYIDQLRFLPSTLNDPDTLYLRATRIPRAIETLQKTFLAMYPPHSQSPNFPPPAIILRAAMDETLNPNNGYYQRFTQLAKEFSMRSAGRWNKSKEMDYVNVLIGKWMPENSQRVAMDSQPRLSGILDTVTSTLAHGSGTRLPSEFYDKRGMAIMNRLVIEEWFSGYSESQEYRALGIGSLLGDVVSRMIVSVNSGREKKSSLGKKVNGTTSSNNPSMATVMLALSGCHVITLASILTSLGAFKFETWPPFTSHITIELFEKFEDSDLTALKMDETSFPARPVQNVSINDRPRQSTQGGHFMDEKRNIESITTIGRKKFNSLHSSERSQLDGYYVRLLFNGQPLTIPGCKASGRHLDGDESFCTLEAFKVIVDKFTPLNWKKDCWSNLDNPAIPTKPEPAGY